MAVMRRPNGQRRSRLQSAADDAAAVLSTKLGRALRDARARRRLTQAEAAALAGISRSEWSGLELGKRGATVWMLNRAAFAVGTSLNAYLPEASAADLPRDAVQLKAQELVLRTAKPGGWFGMPEDQIDREARTSRFGDVVLSRPKLRPLEVALMEIIDWFDDVGAPTREWNRRLEAVERRAIARMVGDDPVPIISGCWLIRATQRNRALVRDHSNFFASRFSGSGKAWLAAMTDPTVSMPTDPALLWVAVNGDRLFATR
jgi:transcriptional regulator with XRE-family HTH domain